MDFQRLKLGNLQKVLIGLSVLLIVVSMVSFLQHIPQVASPRSTMYDKSFIGAMNQLSKSIPQNSVLITSAEATPISYFTDRVAKAPWGASSKESLVDYMERGNYDYLVVLDGKSSVSELKYLFSSEGLKSLDEDFQLIATYCSDFSKIRLYQLKNGLDINNERNTKDNEWEAYSICISDARDSGKPNLANIDTVQIRIADDGTVPISVWLGALSIIDDKGNEVLITDFQGAHGFKKQGAVGTQTDDKSDFIEGTQSLRLETDGDGSPVVTRKSAITPVLDFEGKQLKLWIKISDISKLNEFRVTVTGDEFQNYRNYWIRMPP